MPANLKRGTPRRRLTVLGVLLSLVLATGCSKQPAASDPDTFPSAEAAPSPPVTQAPAGTVLPLQGRPLSAVYDSRLGRLVVLTAGAAPGAPANLVLIDPQQTSSDVIALPGPASGLTGDGNGHVFLSAHGGYFDIDLPVRRVTVVRVRGADHTDFSGLTRRADGMLLLGAPDETLYAVAAGGGQGRRISVHTHVDSLVAQGNTVAVLDRGQTSITTVDPDGATGQSLRAGQGATTMAADSAGRLLVTDTRGGQLLVYGVDPLILRQAYPVAESPYGVTGSRGLAWVSQTATNTVVGYDLSTGIPLEKVRYPSVRQPNALAFDDAAGTLFVLSDAGEGVQVIEHAAEPR